MPGNDAPSEPPRPPAPRGLFDYAPPKGLLAKLSASLQAGVSIPQRLPPK